MSPLLGPSNADHFRVRVGRYGDRWYVDPLPTCPIAEASDWQGPSISATKPPFANKYVPMQAIANMADSEWARLAGVTETARYEAIKSHDKEVARVNMSRGGLVHEWAEDLLHGRPMRMAIGYDTAVTDQAEQFKGALQAFFDTHQPELVAAEVVCLHHTLNGVGYGGTADAIVRVNGDVWVVDWKTRMSDHAAYLEEAAQGGGYAGAEYMIATDTDGQPARMKLPDIAGVLIVSIRPDGFRVYPIDREGAIKAYAAMHRWWVEQRQFVDAKVIGKPWAPKAAAHVEPFDRDRLRARIADLIGAGHEELLRAAWPAGVAPLSKDGQTDAQLRLVLEAVRRVETETSTTFHPDDGGLPAAPRGGLPAPCFPHGPDEPCTCDGCWACPGHVLGCTCDIAWDCEHDEHLDDGAAVAVGDLEALRRRMTALPDEMQTRLAMIAAEAHDAGRSISVTAKPCVRRWEIARALVRWAETCADLDQLAGTATGVATVAQVQAATDTLGSLVSLFTIEQARNLHDTFDVAHAA